MPVFKVEVNRTVKEYGFIYLNAEDAIEAEDQAMSLIDDHITWDQNSGGVSRMSVDEVSEVEDIPAEEVTQVEISGLWDFPVFNR